MDGYALIDKPEGLSSFAAAREVSRALGRVKTGHGGTLDPFATGLLLVLIGSGTRLMQWVVGHDKRYRLEITLGARSNTDDVTGDLVPIHAEAPSRAAVEAALAELAAETEQMPPQVSAIHVDGRRAYRIARSGEHVELSPRAVQFHSVELVDYRASEATVLVVDVSCASGTYMRALARDLGDKLGTGGYASALRRTQIGTLDIADAVALADVQQGAVRPLAELVSHLPSAVIDEEQITAFVRGKRIQITPASVLRTHSAAVDRTDAAGTIESPDAEHFVAALDADGELVGIATTDGPASDMLQPRTVLRGARERVS